MQWIYFVPDQIEQTKISDVAKLDQRNEVFAECSDDELQKFAGDNEAEHRVARAEKQAVTHGNGISVFSSKVNSLGEPFGETYSVKSKGTSELAQKEIQCEQYGAELNEEEASGDDKCRKGDIYFIFLCLLIFFTS